MKYLLFFFFSCAFYLSVGAQNLVSNPSFEDISACPNSDSQLSFANGWTTSINTPDLYNSCANISTGYSTPSNVFGFQYPATGNGYAGFYAYTHLNPQANEFLGAKLLSPLAIGKKYFVSFKISLADANSNLMCGVDNIGILFTNKNWGDTILLPNPLLKNYASAYSTSIITDTLNWTQINLSYIADSAYNYFMIGHFFDSTHSDFMCLDGANINNRFSYYFIDDVCVSADSSACNYISGIVKVNEAKNISLYPNPANDVLNISLPGKTVALKIYNVMGQEFFSEKVENKTTAGINTSGFPEGMYLIRAQIGNEFQNLKFLIKH